MPKQVEDVRDHAGHRIGTVEQVHLGRSRSEFWHAVGLDGCDLGSHPKRIEAEEAVQDDFEAGMPRSPRSPRERWRPIVEIGTSPVLVRDRYA